MLLKVGRHLRPAAHYKLIMGRELGENKYLEGYKNRFVSMMPTSHHGPMVLIDGTPSTEDIETAARLLGRYSQGRDAPEVTVDIRFPDAQQYALTVQPHTGDIPDTWYV